MALEILFFSLKISIKFEKRQLYFIRQLSTLIFFQKKNLIKNCYEIEKQIDFDKQVLRILFDFKQCLEHEI